MRLQTKQVRFADRRRYFLVHVSKNFHFKNTILNKSQMPFSAAPYSRTLLNAEDSASFVTVTRVPVDGHGGRYLFGWDDTTGRQYRFMDKAEETCWGGGRVVNK